MLRRDRQIRTQIHQLADACIFGVSFLFACLLRANAQFSGWLNLDTIPYDAFNNAVWLYVAVIPAAPLILESQNFYNRPPLCPRSKIFWPLAKGCLITTVGLVMATYLLHLVMPRGVIIFFGIISFGMVYLKEELLRLAFKSRFAQFQSKRRFVLAGTAWEIARMRREFKELSDERTEIVAELDLVETPVQQIVSLLHDHSVYGVILSAKHTNFEQVEYVIRACELEGVEVWLLANFFSTEISRTSLDEMLGHPLLIFRTTPEASWSGAAKQLMDFFGAFVLLIIFALPMLAIMLAIKFTSPGPSLFRQKRSGLNGTPFTIYKFRTMTTNAEQFKHELEAMNEMSGPVFKVTNDPRVTPVGKILRKYSLDELPQLFNVVRAEMSLVGPRPLPVDEVKRFENLAHRRRLSVKPGLTCLWQVSGRNQISDFREWVRLDLEYIDNWSLWLDLKILLRTVPAVLRGTGAK
ncbi:MAG TPA: sugar transferase [Verrucomicrobiae bacterium]|nr:sugar transferase [Verrucomicrobiae bacterium]